MAAPAIPMFPRETKLRAVPTRELLAGDHDLGEGCWLQVRPAFAAAEDAALLQTLTDQLPWLQELYLRGSRIVPAPRLTTFHGDPGCVYVYSGITYEAAPWTEALLGLRARIAAVVGCDLNCVLVNLYRDGRDSVGFHADDEPELGPSRSDVVIASLSLGTPRKFVLKHVADGRTLSYALGHGSLLCMRGSMQERWVHALPKATEPLGPRINLSYRVLQQRPERAERCFDRIRRRSDSKTPPRAPRF